jgi:hypothetical protein
MHSRWWRRVAWAGVLSLEPTLVDPLGRETTDIAGDSSKKALQIERADARIRTADPFITSEVLYQLSYVGAVAHSSAAVRADPHRPPRAR